MQPNATTPGAQQTTREIFTGRWAVFNDPLLDHRLIPDDPVNREGLRIALLVSTWTTREIGIYKVPTLAVDFEKLMRYYYTEHEEKDGYIPLCIGGVIGPSVELYCWNSTKEDVDKYAKYRTFEFVLENTKEAFISDMVVLPLVFILGVFGK